MAYLGFGIFVLGLILVIVAPINKKKNARCSAEVQGILNKVIKRSNSQGTAGHTYIYTYTVDGVEYKVKSTIRSSQANNIGDACTLWYNPAKPKDALAHHYDSLKYFRIFLISGIVMVPLGIILFMAGLAR